MRKLFIYVVVAVTSLAFASNASAAPGSQASPSACFGEFSSTFATSNPQSGRLVSTVATSQPQAIGTFASTKPNPPTPCP